MGFSDYVCSPSVIGLTKIKGHPGSNRLKCFEASSRAFFSPELLPFTMQTIHSSSLEKLRLSRVGLSSAHWDKLLRHLSIPTLVELRVDSDCAPSTLIQFLARHPGVINLTIIPRIDMSWRTARVTVPITLSMSTLDGPLPHVLAILRNHHKPPSLQSLAISLQPDDASSNYLTAILQCIGYCNSIGYLALDLPVQDHHRSKMMCHSDTRCAVPVERLGLCYSPLGISSAGDPLVIIFV